MFQIPKRLNVVDNEDHLLDEAAACLPPKSNVTQTSQVPPPTSSTPPRVPETTSFQMPPSLQSQIFIPGQEQRAKPTGIDKAKSTITPTLYPSSRRFKLIKNGDVRWKFEKSKSQRAQAVNNLFLVGVPLRKGVLTHKNHSYWDINIILDLSRPITYVSLETFERRREYFEERGYTHYVKPGEHKPSTTLQYANPKKTYKSKTIYHHYPVQGSRRKL